MNCVNVLRRMEFMLYGNVELRVAFGLEAR